MTPWSPEPEARPSSSSSFSVDGERDDARTVPNSEKAAVTAVLMIAGRGVLHASDQLLVQNYDKAD
jgi:hypothetical protein